MFFSARSRAWQAFRSSRLAVVLAAFLLVAPGALSAKEGARSTGSLATALQSISAEQLPPEGVQTFRLIHQGGPFPYAKDGSVFGNRERLLPAQRRGYYREYTVKKVGRGDRGARRIVCGGDRATIPQACFYTDDHYASFRRIVE